MGVKHKINREYYENILLERNMTQKSLAEQLGENEKNLSRWVNDGYPANKIMSFQKALKLSVDDFGKLLDIPQIKVFFRNRFFHTVSPEVKERAEQWAILMFSLMSRDIKQASIAGIDLSKIIDPEAVAANIKTILKLPDGCLFDEYTAILSRHGIEVVVLPFSAFGLQNDQEQAFSAFDGVDKYVIFVNSDTNKPAMTWNICHELSHLFRLNVAQEEEEEERFAQAVAKFILYPTKFFEAIKDKIGGILQTKNNTSLAFFEAIKDELNASPLSLAIRFSDFKLNTNYLYPIAKAQENKLPKITDIYFNALMNKVDFDQQTAFWQNLDPTNIFFRFFSKIKICVSQDRMTSGKFAELLDIDVSLATSLANSWRINFEAEQS